MTAVKKKAVASNPRKMLEDGNVEGAVKAVIGLLTPEDYNAAKSAIFTPYFGELADIHKSHLYGLNGGSVGRSSQENTRAITNKEYGNMGPYLLRPGYAQMEFMRRWVTETEFLRAIHQTRIRQMLRFMRPASRYGEEGWKVDTINRDTHPTTDMRHELNYLTSFLMNCGDEPVPSERKAKGRDNLVAFMTKAMDDTLTFDQVAVELQRLQYRDSLSGFYLRDGATIFLADREIVEKSQANLPFEEDPNDPTYYVQVVDNEVKANWGLRRMLFHIRNVSSSIYRRGYGFGEAEMVIRASHALWHFVNSNLELLADNHIPHGMLWVKGSLNRHAREDLTRTVRGGTGRKRLGLACWVSDDSTEKADAKWISFQTFTDILFENQSLFFNMMVNNMYGMASEEMNMRSYSSKVSPLSGTDTAERMASSMDKGLVPLMESMSHMLTEIVCEIMPERAGQYVFSWSGLREGDKAFEREALRLTGTVDEMRAYVGLPFHDSEEIGRAPLNQTHMELYTQSIAGGAGGVPIGGAVPGVGSAVQTPSPTVNQPVEGWEKYNVTPPPAKG